MILALIHMFDLTPRLFTVGCVLLLVLMALACVLPEKAGK